ncbi:hypothetical protein BDB00DRAFT_814229 [Zychaea mexicana]|uniref:uncharacterized protein n=1 Tax=Zychaea mexicana TaxID=64656 RepID=UPI0022FF2ED1|nr:uncharacterized protein BDB00DRAFT_814229 [Zychaea mexicana]KAI9495337.1 hypothetical protein BDB00DRAFT_814229 [Zychaea mexicana]
MAHHHLQARLLATLIALFCAVGLTFAADIIRIDQPTGSQQIPSNTDNPFIYTILGAQANGITDAYYPNSFSVDFQWIQNGNDSNVLKFNAISSVDATPAPAGVSDKQYTQQTWKTPNCHFFTRYRTSDYSFSLVVTPTYSTLTLNQTAPGPEQSVLTVPLNIQVNNGTFPRC